MVTGEGGMDKTEIARQIAGLMGWKFKTIDEDTPLRLCTKDGGYILDDRIHRFTIGYTTEIWNPEENIAHALEALESKKLMGTMRLTIGGRKKYVHFSCWCPETERRGEATIHLSQGYTLATATAMAICLAILDAVKGKE